MGSLTSSPKVPSAAPSPQIVYVPSPYTPTDTTTGTGTPAPDPKTPSEVRAGSLLSRDRSRYGTIVTSFRGLLGLADHSDKRKTLLGE
jgi:hypothetical protein